MSPPNLDLDLKTPACVLWEFEDATHSLVEPDPPTRALLFETRFNSETTSASFAIHCPIRLKGIDSHSHILGLIPPNTITSFAFKPYPNPPETVQKKLNCSTVRLRFVLAEPLRLVAPAAATEPVRPRKRFSAEAFDTLRSLAAVKALDVYVPDTELPHAKLNALREAVAQASLKPFEVDLKNTLSSLYSGRGGKLFDISKRENDVPVVRSDEPPAYHEVEPPPPHALEPMSLDKTEPPIAQFAECNGTKRRRLEEPNSQEKVESAGMAWAIVVEMREEMQKLVKRVEHLEKENKELNEELDVLRANCDRANDGVQADEATLLEVQDDLNDLTDRVDFLTKNGIDSEVEEFIVNRVTNRAVTNMLAKNYKLSFEES